MESRFLEPPRETRNPSRVRAYCLTKEGETNFGLSRSPSFSIGSFEKIEGSRNRDFTVPPLPQANLKRVAPPFPCYASFLSTSLLTGLGVSDFADAALRLANTEFEGGESPNTRGLIFFWNSSWSSG